MVGKRMILVVGSNKKLRISRKLANKIIVKNVIKFVVYEWDSIART